MKQKKFGNVLYMYNHTSNARYLRLSNNTLYVYTCNVAYGLQFFLILYYVHIKTLAI